ncbi:MAG: arsenosugar biosynthesis radical SAM (seleno)protein ArsS [bacterium]
MTTIKKQTILGNALEISFEKRLADDYVMPLRVKHPTVMQMNLGYRCNQSCMHCHYGAGPDRSEEMSREVMKQCIVLSQKLGVNKFDLTGGVPELNPNFRMLVSELRKNDYKIIDRNNLTILTEPGQEDLADFLAENHVAVIASLPCYTSEVTDSVRGEGVYEKSIQGLKILNRAGYGIVDSELELTLMYNPSGAFLPGSQCSLEEDFRKQLCERYGITFTNLIAMKNNPTGNFLNFLNRTGNLNRYMSILEQSFNASTVPNLMCLTTLSISYDGTMYDCDFNQALGSPVCGNGSNNVKNISAESLLNRPIAMGNHCYGCTAGSGSSCSGSIIRE